MLFERVRKVGAALDQVRRLRHIAAVLLKYGYDDLVEHLPLPRADRLPLRKVRELQAEIHRLSQPERLRRACEELGPTFVKLGQLAAARTRILPPEFTDELARLQDQVAPMPFAEVRLVLEEEMRRPFGEVFSHVAEEPLGSASIGQVHRARLLDGSNVVIKVQRRGILSTIEEDVGILRHLAGLAETHFPELRIHQPVALVNELARSLQMELDFTAEAAHLERFIWQFEGEPTIHLPAVYIALTTRRVLVMEQVDGIKASNLDALREAGLVLPMLSQRITDLVMKQIFVHGFFHADPHPGNVLILRDGRVCFLDFGQVGLLDLRTRETFIDFVWGIARRNESSVAHALLRLTESELDPARGPFEADVSEFMHRHFYRAAGEIQFTALVKNLAQLTHKHHLYLPPDLVVMLKALGETEELVRRLDPGHDLIAQARPFMKNARMARMRPRRLLAESLDFAQELGETARELPAEIRRILSQVRGGRARLNFHHEGLEPAANALERSANRLSFATVVAALIIGSSLTIHSKVPPLWGDVSVLGLVGYVLAGLMGLWLLIAILRHGKM